MAPKIGKKRKNVEEKSNKSPEKRHKWTKHELVILEKHFPPTGDTDGELKKPENLISKCSSQLGLSEHVIKVLLVQHKLLYINH